MARARWADLVDSSQETPEDPPAAPSCMDRPRWADLADSSQETPELRGCGGLACGLLVEDSYDGVPVADLESSRSGLNGRLLRAVGLDTGPKDFAFLLERTDSGSVTGEVPMTGKSNALATQLERRGIRSKRFHPTIPTPSRKRAKAEELPATPLAAVVTATVSAEATEADWQHRLEKRRKAVIIVKSSPEYRAYADALPATQRGPKEPRTPEVEGRKVSKRRWEQEVQQWRTSLRQWCSERGLAVTPATQESAVPLEGAAEYRVPTSGADAATLPL